MVCGQKLIYATAARPMTCHYCGQVGNALVYCPDSHFVCDACHGADYYDYLTQTALSTTVTDPLTIAEVLLQGPYLPSLGAEHHAIVPAALLAAVRNYGPLSLPYGDTRSITDADFLEAIRRMRQIPACICASHGACGAGLGVGAFFSIVFGATCAKDVERTIAMRASNIALAAIADCGGPGCCKQSVRTAILASASYLKELCHIALPLSHSLCFHRRDTTHGCKGAACRFSHG